MQHRYFHGIIIYYYHISKVKITKIYKKNKNSLDILPILWENIVLEIPIRVVAESVKPSNTSGDGWELISE